MSKTLSQIKRKNGSGGVSMNVLRLASDVVDGQQVVIGSDTYEVDIINTDSTINTSAAMNNTDLRTTLTMTAHGRVVNQCLRVEDELLRVSRVIDANTIEVIRGIGGSSVEAHVSGSDIYQSNAAPAAPIISLPLVTTLTPALAQMALVDAINSVGKEKLFAEAITDNEIVIRTRAGYSPMNLPCTETLAGSNNGWSAAAMYGSITGEVVGMRMAKRAATAVEVALDHMFFDFPFTVGSAIVEVQSTAGVRNVAWNGAWTISGKRVTVTNGGASDWIAGDIVTVLASE